MKFGGTSVGGAAAIRKAVQVVQSQLARRPVVVVSAQSGVTDALIGAMTAAAAGADETGVDRLLQRHRQTLASLDIEPTLLDPLLEELQHFVRGIRLVGEASPKALDALLSFGERLSARTVAAALQQQGTPASAVDAYDIGLLTDSSFGRARPLPDEGRLREALVGFDEVPIVTGFLGADQRGNITTLGRNGSDFSAAWIGAAVGAEEIQIWKDVDGVHTADPRIVADARPIPRMSFAEVADLASFGSTVLHPAAMVPAMRENVPIVVRNTLRPQAPGTRIEQCDDEDAPIVRAIAHKTEMALITVRSRQLLRQHTFLASVFGQLASGSCDVGPVAVGEAAVTVAVAESAARRARQHLAEVGDVEVRRDCAMVGVVGHRRALERGVLAAVLSRLSQAEIPVRCAGLGPRGSTVAAVIDAGRLIEAVGLLHRHFVSEAGDDAS